MSAFEQGDRGDTYRTGTERIFETWFFASIVWTACNRAGRRLDSPLLQRIGDGATLEREQRARRCRNDQCQRKSARSLQGSAGSSSQGGGKRRAVHVQRSRQGSAYSCRPGRRKTGFLPDLPGIECSP